MSRRPRVAIRVLGIMSGTSLDGVDYAVCRVDPASIRLQAAWHVPFPPALYAHLDAAAAGRLPAHTLAQLHHELGRFYAAHADFARGVHRPHLIGLHGQTIYHHPHQRAPATFQLGEPAYLVERMRVPVVSNFRVADLAAGGQGAPLATQFHLQVFAERGAHVCVNNLGGISNVTSLDWRRGRHPRILAFDTGPGNVLLNLAMAYFSGGRKRFDRDGTLASQGQVHTYLLQHWLRCSFYRRPPPKSTGREFFGEPFLKRVLLGARRAGLRPADVLATLAEFTAQSIALNYRWHLPAMPSRVILAGGGGANPVLVERIRGALQASDPDCVVQRADECGWPLSTIEPAAFAWLAYLRWHGRPGNCPHTTGAARPVLCGQVAEP